MVFHRPSSAKHHLERATEAVYGRHVQYTGGLCLSAAAGCLKWAKPCKEAPALLSGTALVPASLTPGMKNWPRPLCLPSPILPALPVKQKQAQPLNAAVGLLPASGHREGSFQRKEVMAPRWIPPLAADENSVASEQTDRFLHVGIREISCMMLFELEGKP